MKEGKVRGEERMGGSKQRGRKEERRERGRNNCYAVRMDQLMYHHYAEILSEFHQKCVLVLHKNLKIVCKYRTLFRRFI